MNALVAIMDGELVGENHLVESLEERLEELQVAREEQLERLSSLLVSKRNAAMTARHRSGIEELWDFCDSVLNSEGAHNIGDSSNWYKPTGPDGTPIMKARTVRQGKSTAFINITESVVLFAAWAAKEMAMPQDGKFWSLQRTPEGAPEELLGHLDEADARQQELMVSLAQKLLQDEEQELAQAELRIKDMLSEGVFSTEDLAVAVFDAAASKGTAVVHGPVTLSTPGKKDRPSFRPVDVGRIYPDPACGADIKNGSFIFEGPEPQSARALRQFRVDGERDPDTGWILEALTKQLEEGTKQEDAYEFWYFAGEIPAAQVKPLLDGVEAETEKESDAEPHIWVTATMCGDKVVRLGMALLQNEIPYTAMKWGRRKYQIGREWFEHWAGMPMPWKLKPLQNTMNVNWRSLDDNTQLCAVPQRITWKGIIRPANGRHDWEAGKDWFVESRTYSQEALKEVKNAITTIDIPCRLGEIRASIPLTLQMIGPVTGLDDVVRGLTPGAQVGTTQVQLNAASHLAKRTSFYWQNFFTELVEKAIRWEQEYGGLGWTPELVLQPPPTQIVRDTQANAMVNFLGLATNPVYGQDPKKLADSYLQGNQFDPTRTQLSPEKAQQMAEAAKPPPDEKAQAAIQSAQVRAEANVEAERISSEAKQMQTALRAESDARDRVHDEQMLLLKYRLELMSYAMQKGIDVQAAVKELEEIEVPREGIKALMQEEAPTKPTPKEA